MKGTRGSEEHAWVVLEHAKAGSMSEQPTASKQCVLGSELCLIAEENTHCQWSKDGQLGHRRGDLAQP